MNLVIEPKDVKTVSNFNVSFEKLKELVAKFLSFLQEIIKMINRARIIFIGRNFITL